MHTFREKGLCSSANYHADLIDAMREFAALPQYTALQVNDRAIRGERSVFSVRGFFYEPLPEIDHSGTGSNYRGGGSEFAHHNRRYRQGWNAGKPEDEVP